MANSIASASNPTPTWVNISGTGVNNIHNQAYTVFGSTYDPTTDPNSIKLNQADSLNFDHRRLAIYASPSIPSVPADGYYPVLYVASNSGVYQSLNDGQTWTSFPEQAYGGSTNGGYLPHVSVTDLDMSLGNIDANTGMPNTAGPYNPNPAKQTTQANADPDILLATTYGQGEFAINLAPLIIGNAVAVSPTTPGTGTGALPSRDGPVTIGGLSEISAFGNATWITVEDVTNPADPVVIAGFNPADAVPTPSASNSTNAVGNFTIPFDPASYYMTNGQKTIEIFATDNAGSVGNKVTYTFNLNDPNLPQPPPTTPPSLAMQVTPSAVRGTTTGTDGGAPITITITNLGTPLLIGTVSVGATVNVQEYEYDSADGKYDTPYGSPFAPTIAANGTFSFPFSNPDNLSSGNFKVDAVATYSKYPGLGSTENDVYIQIADTTPAAVTDFRLNPSSDTGIIGDDVTTARTPVFIGTAPAGDTVELLVSGSSTVYSTAIAQSTTSYDLNNHPYDFTIQLPFVLNNGSITLQVIVTDAISGNPSPLSNPASVMIVSVASDYNGDSYSDAALYSPNTSTNQGSWLVQTTSEVPATPVPPRSG